MSVATIAVIAEMIENETAPVADWKTDGFEEGVVEVERSDENVVTVHFRSALNEVASVSAQMDRAGAIALARALEVGAETDG